MDNPEKLATYTCRVHKTNQNKEKHNPMCAGHDYVHAITNNIDKTWALLLITGGKDESNIVVSPLDETTMTVMTRDSRCFNCD